MKTPETHFSYIPSIGDNLLSVRAGVPLAIAAELAKLDRASETKEGGQ